MDTLLHSNGLLQRSGVCHTDVFDCHPHQSTSEIHPVLASLQHPSRANTGCLHVARTHRLVESRYQVVMFLATLVVKTESCAEERFPVCPDVIANRREKPRPVQGCCRRSDHLRWIYGDLFQDFVGGLEVLIS